MPAAISRPALRYYGGKWRLAPWILSFFPPHKQYIEPCGGAASVLLQKAPAPLETYNDLDGRVVNFFRVLREHPEELLQRIRLTPWARAEFEYSREISADPIEDARRFWVVCWQSISKPGGSWRAQYDYQARPRSPAMDGIEITHLYQLAERFKRVQIEHRDALDVIRLYGQGRDTLVYFDPPYVRATRTNQKYYRFDADDDFHVRAAELLRELPGFVVVSGYRSDLYARLYEAHGWRRVDSASVATNGAKRRESVWLSPRTVGNLSRQLKLL